MRAKLEITGFAHLGLRVHDLARSRAFYEGFGFEFILGPVGPEPVAILKHPTGVEINLILNSVDAEADNILMDVEHKHSGYTHVALKVDSVEAAVAHLTDSKIKISGGPIDYPGGARGVFIRDPDNNVVEFYQSAKG